MTSSTKRRLSRGVRFGLIVSLLTCALFALQTSPAMACQCSIRTSLHDLAGADVVFTGRLMAIDSPPLGQASSTMDPVDYRFEVDEVIKGAVAMSAQVRSVVSGGSCGLERMAVGERYTVFAVARENLLHSGLCSGTHPGDPDPALAVMSDVMLAPTPGAPPWWALILVAIAGALGATVGRRGWRILRNRRLTSPGG